MNPIVRLGGYRGFWPWACYLHQPAVGCGYAHRPTFPQGIRTVAVPIFDNRSFYRGAERDVTEALIKQIELETPYKVVAPTGADTELSGSIVAINSGVLSRDTEGGVPQEEELRRT